MTPAIPHRATFPEAVREALGILDRVSEGQLVPQPVIEQALRLTGDVGWKFPTHEPIYGLDFA
jgi:hypothetical protein